MGLNVYLAGPMRGIPEFNFPAFFAAEAELKKRGYIVFNPAAKGAEKEALADPTCQEKMDFRRKVFLLDTEYICKYADAVALMPGWEDSAGARAEAALAQAIGLEIFEI